MFLQETIRKPVWLGASTKAHIPIVPRSSPERETHLLIFDDDRCDNLMSISRTGTQNNSELSFAQDIVRTCSNSQGGRRRTCLTRATWWATFVS